MFAVFFNLVWSWMDGWENTNPRHLKNLSFHYERPAGIILGLVWVGILGINTTIVLDILEGEVHETAIAPIVAVADRAIDQVLFTQRDKFSCLAEVLSLQSSSC